MYFSQLILFSMKLDRELSNPDYYSLGFNGAMLQKLMAKLGLLLVKFTFLILFFLLKYYCFRELNVRSFLLIYIS